MGLQHFQSDETLRSTEALRAQRMTADEAASVIALWQQEQTELTGLTDRPAVPDVAEGLDITVEDVQRLLEAVRAQRLEAEQRLAQEQELAEAEKRLAEEERRLESVLHDQPETYTQPSLYAKHGSGTIWIVTILIVTFLVLLLAFTTYNSPSTGDCTISSPNGTSRPCGPDFYRAHPELNK